MSSERIRSFIAVDLDDVSIREKIASVQRGLEGTGAQLKMVEPSIMHLTLRFLGEIPAPVVENVKSVLDSASFRSFPVHFSGLGAFPNLNRINVVWVGMTEGQGQLQDIFRQIEPKLRQLGIPADDKGFNPHLTIARVRSGLNKQALAEYVMNFRDQDFGTMQVNAVRLKRSTLTPKGPIYTTIHEKAAT